MLEYIIAAIALIYFCVFIFMYLGIRKQSNLQDVGFSPIQPIVAFFWIIWTPFYIFSKNEN